MTVRIHLGPQQIAFAHDVAAVRERVAIARGRRPGNGLVADQARSLRLNVVGALAEIAAWKYLKPVVWHHLADRIAGLPDLGRLIEVKGVVGVASPSIIVPPCPDGSTPPRNRVYLLVDGTAHPAYDLLGWLWGHEFLDAAHWDNVVLKRPAWRAKSGYHPPAALLGLVRLGAV